MSAVATGNPFGAECGNALQATFDTCVRSGLFNPFTMQFADDIPSFCAPQKLNGDYALYTCMCQQATMVVRCYQVNCPGEVIGSQNATKYETEQCNEMAKHAPTSATTKSLMPLPTGGPVLPPPGASITAAPSSKPSTTADNASGAMELVGGAVAGILALLLA
ncbi:hypothetical protein HDU98_005325 [Podochytrium sp. JEL0797]|nr:hypothetical protein HDU98_005325 [Podochytrium sp. JEL0797]